MPFLRTASAPDLDVVEPSLTRFARGVHSACPDAPKRDAVLAAVKAWPGNG
jgi:hypothetical protein